MLLEEIKNFKDNTKELRKFGVTMAFALAAVGGLILYRHKDYYWVFFLLSTVFLCFGLLCPVLLKPIYKSWMTLGIVMGWFVSKLILAIVFYLVLTPIALLMRVSGKDFLNIKFKRNSSGSYWLPKQNNDSENRNYEKQF